MVEGVGLVVGQACQADPLCKVWTLVALLEQAVAWDDGGGIGIPEMQIDKYKLSI